MTVTEDKAYESAFGQPLRRKEDAHLITGQTRWTDNLNAPGMLYACYLRSPMAHAKFTIDTTPAKSYPGVVAVFSAADFGAAQAVIPDAWTVHPDMKKPVMTPLATDEVRYAGEPIAVVVAETRYQAADALEAINVDYDPLPAVVDMEAACSPDSPLVHESIGTNVCFDIQSPGEGYEAAKAQAQAEGGVVITRRFLQQRLLPTPMEPRAVLVVPTIDDLTVYASTQIPHVLRLLLAMLTGHPEHKLRVVAPGRRRRLRRQDQLPGRGDHRRAPGQASGPAGEVDRVALGELPADAPRPRAGPGHRDRGDP